MPKEYWLHETCAHVNEVILKGEVIQFQLSHKFPVDTSFPFENQFFQTYVHMGPENRPQHHLGDRNALLWNHWLTVSTMG